jgi:hypothetical protein
MTGTVERREGKIFFKERRRKSYNRTLSEEINPL